MARRLATDQSEREMFLASVAHELKTPLTVLGANLEGLATGALRPTPERSTMLLRDVHRLTRLVNDLLRFLGKLNTTSERQNYHLILLRCFSNRLYTFLLHPRWGC